jgi:transcription elongation factor Elf1
MGNTVKKVYVHADGLVLFVCPNCGEVQRAQAQVYKNIKGPINIQCKCGTTYEVEVEFRKLFRKEVKLDGIYSTSNSGNWQKMIIKIYQCKDADLTR